MNRVSSNGAWVWEIKYGGMVRTFPEFEHWRAKQFFEYVMSAMRLALGPRRLSEQCRTACLRIMP